MILQARIETARCAGNVPKYVICDALNLNGEDEYQLVITGRYQLSIYQKIMLFVVFEGYREGMPLLIFDL